MIASIPSELYRLCLPRPFPRMDSPADIRALDNKKIKVIYIGPLCFSLPYHCFLSLPSRPLFTKDTPGKEIK